MPSRVRVPRVELPSAVPVQEATAKLGKSALSLFRSWLKGNGLSVESDDLLYAPAMLDLSLEQFGRHLWRSGEPLHNLLHYLTSLQRSNPALRGRLKRAWTTVTIWEAEEPVCHRPPVPQPLMEAIAATALGLGEPRFAGVVRGAYGGAARVGEFLAAHRRDLLLPADLLSEEFSQAFLAIQSPKTGKRGGGRAQHIAIDDERVVRRFLSKVFGDLPPRSGAVPGRPSNSALRGMRYCEG